MRQIVSSLEGRRVTVVVESGSLGAGLVDTQVALDAAERAEAAAADAEAAAAGAESIGEVKLDRDGGNYEPALLENVGFQPIVSEDFYRPTVEKLRDIVNAQDAPDFDLLRPFNAKAPLEALFAARLEDGGEAMLPSGIIYVSDLTIPPGVSVKGAGSRPGEENTTRDYTKLGTVIWLDPAGTITLENMASLENVTILNPKVRYVTVTDGVPDCTEAQIVGTAPYTTGPFAGQYAGVAQFSGTAITNNGDDTRVNNVLVVGFNKAYKSATYTVPRPGLPPGPSRPNISNFWFDCTNGIDLSDCWDIPTIVSPHGWGFFVAHTGFSWAAVKRDGICYNIHDHVDGLMMTNAFTLGWKNSYRFKDIYAAVLTGCTGDGLVEGSLSDPDAIGFLTEGVISGLHLNGQRCDGNKRNFSFQHVTGMVTGQIMSGQTASGTHVEVGAYSNGITLDVVVAGPAVDAIRIRDGARNWTFPTITAYYLNDDIGEMVKFDTPSDIQKGSIGWVNREVNGSGQNSYGFRSYEKIVAGGQHPAVVEMRGAATGAVQVAALSAAEASIDIEARGAQPDGSVVGITRRTLGGVRQLLARFDAANIVPPNFLFRGQATSALNIIAEGAAGLIHIILTPKGGGAVQTAGPLFAGTDQADFVQVNGGSGLVEVRAQGTSGNVRLDLSGKGSGGVALFDVVGGATKYVIARFTRSSDIAANFVVNAASDSQVTIGAENGGTNVTLAVAGKGTGGVRLDTGPTTYENDAAAAAGGIPVNSTYVMAAGYLRKRLT